MIKWFFLILDFTYCVPQTLLGLLIKHTLYKDCGVIKIEKLKKQSAYIELCFATYLVERRLKNIPLATFSLGRYIFMRKDDFNNRNTFETDLSHEFGHSRQSRMLGFLYLLIVGLTSFTLNIVARFNKKIGKNYYKMFPEIWADKLGKVKR